MKLLVDDTIAQIPDAVERMKLGAISAYFADALDHFEHFQPDVAFQQSLAALHRDFNRATAANISLAGAA